MSRARRPVTVAVAVLSAVPLALLVTAGDGAAAADAAGGGVPGVLADGSIPPRMPAALRRFERRPVVRAAVLARPRVPRWCAAGARAHDVTGWLSPEGLSVTFAERQTSLPRACDSVFAGRRWRRCSVGIARAADPRAVERAGGALGVCGTGRRWRAFMWIRSNPRSAWALVRRQTFWVGYRVRGTRLIRISGSEPRGRYDRFRTTVVFATGDGRVVERRGVLGIVAG